jgi:hypothetical protein
MASSVLAPPKAAPRETRGHHDRGPSRLRRIAIVASVVALVPAAISYVSAMSGPSNTALGVRSVEWLRDNGAAGIVGQIETWYYSLTAPSKGGPARKALPKVGVAGGVNPPRVVLPVTERPQAVAPMIAPVLAGEGVWKPTRAGLGSAPPLLVTTFRDEPAYPRVVIGLAWIDTKRTQVSLIPGRIEPTVALPSRAMEVPFSTRNRLLATFNSGFKLRDSGGSLGTGGYVLGGTTYAAMKTGLATLVGYRDGRIDIVNWTHGPTAPSSVLYARQNLPLIVDHGLPSAELSNNSAWGATIGGAVLVARSGVGIDSHGNLIYAAGSDQTVVSLADALIRAGAVRAMELDINPYWVSFITYSAFGALGPANLLPDMTRVATRYLTPDDRDFFAVYLRK